MRAKEELRIENKRFFIVALIIDIIYSIMFLYYGIKCESTWNISVGSYLTVLSLINIMLFLFLIKNIKTRSKREENTVFHLTGVLLLISNIIFSYSVLRIVKYDEQFSYINYIFYSLIVYILYKTCYTILVIVKYRDINSSLLSSIKIINIIELLLSIIAIQIAILFKIGGNNLLIRTTNIIVAETFTLVIYIIGIYMRLNRINKPSKHEK